MQGVIGWAVSVCGGTWSQLLLALSTTAISAAWGQLRGVAASTVSQSFEKWPTHSVVVASPWLPPALTVSCWICCR